MRLAEDGRAGVVLPRLTSALLKLLNRCREEAEKVGHKIERIAVAFEAGRDGFRLARWLRARGIEAHVIHALASLMTSPGGLLA
jgi:transposase